MPNLYQFASILMQNRVFCFKIRKQKETVVFRSYSLGPLMKYCLIAFIQLIETCISLGWRLVKYKFQFVEFRQYDNIFFSWTKGITNSILKKMVNYVLVMNILAAVCFKILATMHRSYYNHYSEVIGRSTT